MIRVRLVLVVLLATMVQSCTLFDITALTVLSWTPKDSTLATVDGVVVRIQFSRAVSKTRTEQAFSLTADGSTLPGRISWPDDATLLFTPDEPLRDLAVYTLRVSTQAEDTEGRDLAPAFDHTFTTRTDFVRPAVAAVTPADHVSITDTLTPVVVTFSKAMDRASVDDAFSLSPTVSGYLSLAPDGKALTFTPSQALLWQTAYTVTIGTNAADTQHNTMGTEFTSHFYTGVDRTPPTVSSVRSADSSITLVADNPNDAVLTVTSEWEATEGLVVTFFEPVLTSSAVSSVEISPSVQTTIQESNTASTTTLSYSFPERLSFGATYTLTIDPGILDLQGNKTSARTVYHFLVNGPTTKPPMIAHVYYPSAAGDPSTNAELHPYDSLALPASADTFFDLYVDLATGATIDRFLMASSFSVSTTNGAADITPFAVQSGPTQVNPAVSGPTEVVERVWVHVTNETASGQVVLHVSTGLKDSAGNALASEYVLPLNDPD